MKWFIAILVAIMSISIAIAVYIAITPVKALSYGPVCELEGHELYILDNNYRYHATIECNPCDFSPCECRGVLELRKETQFSPSYDTFVAMLPFTCSGIYIKIANMPCKARDNKVYCYAGNDICIPIEVPGEKIWVPRSSLEIELDID